MKTYILTLTFAVFSLGLFSQNFEVPQNYKLEKAEDYAPYENDVINCINWLRETPVITELDKRKEANTFLLQWMTGSPYVHLEIQESVVTFLSTSPELLLVFLGGWTKYAIETKDYDNKLDGSLAGIEAVIYFYNKNRESLPKDKDVEKYIKRQKKGKLRSFLETKV
jgi:hypothetical protein